MDTRVQPGDVILVHIQKRPSFYGRVEEILPDVKIGWCQLRFQVLTLPPQEITWILEPCQIDGDPFTMGGTDLQIERLPDPLPAQPAEPEDSDGSTGPGAPAPSAEKPAAPGRVIHFPPRPKT